MVDMARVAHTHQAVHGAAAEINRRRAELQDDRMRVEAYGAEHPDVLAGVPLRGVQLAARYSDPRTTTFYDHCRQGRTATPPTSWSPSSAAGEAGADAGAAGPCPITMALARCERFIAGSS